MQTYLDTQEDMYWLFDVHLRGEIHEMVYDSAILYGKEDCPYRIELYAQDAMDDSPPIAVYELRSDILGYRIAKKLS